MISASALAYALLGFIPLLVVFGLVAFYLRHSYDLFPEQTALDLLSAGLLLTLYAATLLVIGMASLRASYVAAAIVPVVVWAFTFRIQLRVHGRCKDHAVPVLRGKSHEAYLGCVASYVSALVVAMGLLVCLCTGSVTDTESLTACGSLAMLLGATTRLWPLI